MRYYYDSFVDTRITACYTLLNKEHKDMAIVEITDYHVRWTEAKSLEIAKWAGRRFKMHGFERDLVTTVRNRSNRSWGGCKRIKGSMRPFQNLNISRAGGGVWPEYKSIAHSKDFGRVNGASDMRYLTLLICHEMAHAIVYNASYVIKGNAHNELVDLVMKEAVWTVNNKNMRGHDKIWQRVYTILRRKYVNDVEITHPEKIAPAKIVKQVKARVVHNDTVVITRHKNQWGEHFSLYRINGKAVAIGKRGYGGYMRGFKITFGTILDNEFTPNGDDVCWLENGRTARKVVKEACGYA